MDTNAPHRDDELSEFERRLTAWRPEPEGLHADSMFFAAGIAVGRQVRGGMLGRVLFGLMAALALGLGAWGLSERADRLQLASRIGEPAASSTTSTLIATSEIPKPSYKPSSCDYFSLRRALIQNPDRWLASMEPTNLTGAWPPPTEPPILTPRLSDGLLDQ